ncbi:hypothetical protein AAFP32_04520 [Brevibacterium sp. CBA3109]|uniref:Uncharacterized protein n=1 Tax=Brevibacterium koreense TaxID=3140787 RepID=A0AAU7UN70_9MICO
MTEDTDRNVAARALREAADDLELDGRMLSTIVWRFASVKPDIGAWLRDRADRIEEETHD